LAGAAGVWIGYSGFAMRLIFALGVAGLCSLAMAGDFTLDAELTPFNLTGVTSTAVEPDQPAEEIARPFGSPGSSLFTLGGGVAYAAKNGSSSTNYNAYVAWNYFLITDLEFSLELGGWYFNQPGQNQGGVNPELAFRWHFVNKQTWSLFLEAGVGLLAATGDVPTGGTSFDFMPRAGGGFTYELSPGGARLQAGVRWFHVSNARIQGDANNPARDGVMGFVGIMFPLH
jgi:hypothetical protein